MIFKIWLKSQKAATAVEYGLIVAAIAVAISAGVLMFGDNLAIIFDNSAALVSERP